MLRDLKEFEKAHPFAAYLDKEVVKAAPIEAMDVAEAILPDDINIILDPAKVPAKSGYCMLENGGSYISVKTTLPGTTVEMLRWLVAWQGLDPVNYMAINPATHHSAAVGDLDREKINRPYLSLEQKCEGIYVYSVDEMAGKLVGTITAYYSPADQGFCMDAYVNSGATVFGGYTLRQDHEVGDPQKKALTITMAVARETAEGVELHTHAWMGYKMLRREVKRFDVNGIQPTEETTAELAQFMADELAQVANVLPELYKAAEGNL